MLNSPIDILLLGAVILVAAFLCSWLAFFINARRANASIPEPADQDLEPESVAQAAPIRPAEPPPVRHAFDFSDDQVTMILEMPIETLEDDATLADVWVDVVSWARIAWRDVQEGKLTMAEEASEEPALDESEITREHLEGSLQRLHDAAERRRELRLKLAERREDALQESAKG